MSEIHPSRQNQIQDTTKNTPTQPTAKAVKAKRSKSDAPGNAVKPAKRVKQVPVKSTSHKIISKNAARNERRKKARQVAALLGTKKTPKKSGKDVTATEGEKMEVEEDTKESKDTSTESSSDE